uniref:ATP-dependent RNA helicase DDX23 n=1 Tax=Arundo donax TaxID=35708 RepID=A0A0A9H0M9_ARUDO
MRHQNLSQAQFLIDLQDEMTPSLQLIEAIYCKRCSKSFLLLWRQLLLEREGSRLVLMRYKHFDNLNILIFCSKTSFIFVVSLVYFDDDLALDMCIVS